MNSDRSDSMKNKLQAWQTFISELGYELSFCENGCLTEMSPVVFLRNITGIGRGEDSVELRKSQLTKREREILGYVSKGKTNQEIALILSVSVRTVEKHLESLFRKLNTNRRQALIHTINESDR